MKSSKDSRFNNARTFIGILVAAALALLAGAAVVATSGTASAQGGEKWFVCKYVTTPDDEEVLQTGQNPISVSENAIPVDPVYAGAEFTDGQGTSIVLVEDTGQPEPDPSECPTRGTPLVQPDPQVTVATESQSSCDGVQSRTKTVTTAYVLNADESAYVLGTPGAPVYSAWTMDRALTDAESAALGCDEVAGVDKPTTTTPRTTTTTTTVAPAEAVPTAVSAGLGDTSGSSGSLVGQGLMAGGLLLLLLAGVSRFGRREGGAHEA